MSDKSPKPAAVTMKAVATRAGVSTMSVSNVLNGRNVRPNVREAVLKAVKELNFTPNETARKLRRGKSPVIGILHLAHVHPFFTAMMLGALMAAVRNGARLLPQPVVLNDAAGYRAAFRTLNQRGADAVLVGPIIADHMTPEDVAAAGTMPLLAIAPGVDLSLMGSVRIDERGAAREITELLIEKGHRDIGFLRADTGGVRESRYAGYRDALEAHGIALRPELVLDSRMTFEAGLASAGRMLDFARPPTAIVGSNDDMAAGALVAAHSRRLAIPDDIAIAGFDDSDLSVKVWPALTTVRVPIQEMAERAMDILIPRSRGDRTQSYAVETFIAPHQIIRRASTGD
ncbi:MAG TPA: LacI family DNA-binding transcriptional regulator [Sphingobium sp.]